MNFEKNNMIGDDGICFGCETVADSRSVRKLWGLFGSGDWQKNKRELLSGGCEETPSDAQVS